jgi:hypothetical protein
MRQACSTSEVHGGVNTLRVGEQSTRLMPKKREISKSYQVTLNQRINMALVWQGVSHSPIEMNFGWNIGINEV